MGLLDLFKSEEESKTPLLDALSHGENVETGLTNEVKGYVNDLGSSLGYQEGSFNTEEDWDALDESESKRLADEEETGLMARAISGGMSGEGIESLKESAATLANTQKTGRIPHAAAISAAREDLAESDVENEENRQRPTDWKRMQQNLNENRAIIQSMSMRAEEKASKEGSWGDLGRDILGTAGGIEAWRAKKALDVLGLSTGKILKESVPATVSEALGRVNAAHYYEIFNAFMQYVAATRSPAETVDIVTNIEEVWNKEGINPYLQAEFWRQARQYSPGLATFNVASLGLSSIFAGKQLVNAGVAVKNGMYKLATKYSLQAAGEAAQIPLSDTIVETTFKGVNRIAKVPSSTDEITRAMKKAFDTNNQKIIRDTAEQVFGTPTIDKSVIRAENKDGIVKYFVDDVVMPTTNPERSVANDVEVLASKIKGNYNTRLNAILSEISHIDEIKKDIIGYLWKEVSDSLDLNNLVAAGRGTYGEKIVGFSDLIETKGGHQVFLLRLSDDKKPTSSLLSRIIDGEDKGFKEAERIGKRLTEAVQVTNKGLEKPFGIGYRVEKRNGYWIPTIEIDTYKGFGVLHFEDLLKKGVIKQEQWRPFLSSLATWTSNPTDIQVMDILRANAASIIKATGVGAEEMFKGLSKEDKRIVQTLFDISTMYGAWYDPADLLARGVSQKAVETYMAGKLVNDFSYFVLNKVERADLIAKGGKKVYFNNKELEGVVRPVRDYHSPAQLKEKIGNRRVLVDSIDGSPVTLSDDEVIKDLYNKGYILIEPSISPDAKVAARSFFYLLNPESTTINDLGTFVMTYVPGGRRFFDRRSTFLKQLVMEDRVDKPGVSILGVQTLFADLDQAGMVERAAWLNRIRDAWFDGDTNLVNSIIGERSISKVPFKDNATFEKWANEVGIDMLHKENRIEAVKGEQILDSYNSYLRRTDVEDLVGMENMRQLSKNAHFQAISNEAKLQRAKRTGRELLTWDFDVAQPVDFEMQMRYLVQDMIEADVMGEYTKMYADRFAETFKPVLVAKDPFGHELTPMELLLKGDFVEGVQGDKAKLLEQAKTAREYYKFVRGTPSQLDTEVAKKAKSLFEWIGGELNKFVPEAYEGLAHKARVDWTKIQSQPLLQYQRTIAAHFYLGCFNVSQFWKQAFQDVSIALLDSSAPRFAGDALALTTVMLRSNGSKLEAIRLAKEAFKDDQKMLNNALNIIDMGLFEHGTAGGFLEKGQTVSSKLSRLSFLPFNFGEMQPRLLSGLTALNKEGLYGVRATPTQLRKPTLYAKALYMNMDGIGMSRLQNSQIAQTLLQFMNPRLRWLETIFFDKNLTGAQRGRLFLGTFLLTGSQGLLGRGASSWVANNVYRMFHNENEEELPALKDRQDIWSIMWDISKRGLPNTLSDRSGLGVNLVSPLEIEVADIVDAVTNAADLDIVSFQVLGKFGRAAKQAVILTKHLLMGDVTSREFDQALDKFLVNAPSSFKPVLAYNMYKTGEMLNAKGELVDRMNSKLQAFFVGLGFEKLSYKKLAEYWADFNEHSSYMKALEDEAYEIALDCVRYNLEKDWNTLNTLFKTSNLPDRDRASVWKKVWGRARSVEGTSKVDRAVYDQYVRGGTYGTNFIEGENR